MSLEAWRTPSGRTATIDLAQPPEQVEVARRMLREEGAKPAHEDGRPGVGAPDAAETNPQPSKEQK